MTDVYAEQPSLENELTLLRPLADEDAEALLACYADPYAAPFFNADNCNGDDFRYTTKERMAEAIAFWRSSYETRQFVRWTVVDQSLQQPVGTVEMFALPEEPGQPRQGILRVDLQSRFETRTYLYALIRLCLAHFYDWFGVQRILTKAIPAATERRAALEAAGFTAAPAERLPHTDYFERNR